MTEKSSQTHLTNAAKAFVLLGVVLVVVWGKTSMFGFWYDVELPLMVAMGFALLQGVYFTGEIDAEDDAQEAVE